jgi:diguanylate cyclase (GGDEF)-like protein
MSTVRLARLTLIVALTGVSFLALVAGLATRWIGTINVEHDRLVSLAARADSLSSRADALLLRSPSDEAIADFERDTMELIADLATWRSLEPGVERGTAALNDMLTLARSHASDVATSTDRRLDADLIATMTRMAAYGDGLDATMATLQRAWERRRASTMRVLTVSFSTLAILFGVSILAISRWLRRRVARPVADLATVARRVAAGEYGVRAPSHHRHELGDLASTLNDMLDQLEERNATVSAQRRLIDLAGSVARIGGWSMDLETRSLRWSPMMFEIHELDRDVEPTVEAALRFYEPEDHDAITAAVERCASDGTPFDIEARIVTAQHRRLWIRAIGQPVRDSEGRIVALEGAFQDIDARKRSEERVERAGRRLQQVLEAIGDGFITLDQSGRATYVNRAAARLLAIDPGSTGRDLSELLGDALKVVDQRRLVDALRQNRRIRVEARGPDARWLELTLDPAADGWALAVRDQSEAHRLLNELRSRETELFVSRNRLAHALEVQQALISALPAHIAVIGHDGTVLDVNEGWRTFGRSNEARDASFGVGANYLSVARTARGPGSEEGVRAADLIEAVLAGTRQHASLEYPCHAPGEERWFRMIVRPLQDADGGAPRAVVMHVDVTEAKLAERSLERLAFEDATTGLLSRTGLLRALGARLRQEEWRPSALVVALDLQGFSAVNDRYGFDVGDRLLAAVGERLEERFRTDALLARVGGDEFAFVFDVDDDPDATERRLAELTDELFADPFRLDANLEIALDSHVGFTRLADAPRSPDDLLREAQLALFYGRSTRRLGWTAYSHLLDDTLEQRHALAGEIRRALAHEEFVLHYHPQVQLATGRMVSAEALVRWQHPDRGLLPPSAFVETAERTGLIVSLGRWVLEAACRTLAQWQRDGLDLVRIAVNVSAEQFASGEFADDVRATLARHGVAPSSLMLEVTETVFVEESEVLRVQLDALHALGVKVALDDFGTGYSSLMYLKAYPFDHIKIDRSFVTDMMDDAYSRAVVETVVRIGDTLGTVVVAEGVETEAQRDALVSIGCAVAQGYLFTLPLNEEDFRWLLETRSTLPLARGS